MQHTRHGGLRRCGVAARQGDIFQRAGGDTADRAHRADGAIAVRVRGIGCKIRGIAELQRTVGQGLPRCQRFDLAVHGGVDVAQRDIADRAVVLAHETDVIAASLRNGLTAQLKVDDGHAGRAADRLACQGDVLAELRDGRPRHRVSGGRHLGDRGCIFVVRSAVDRDAAARPVQAVGTHALRDEGIGCRGRGGDAAPAFRPAGVVKMAEIFQLGAVFRTAQRKEGVFGVRVGLLAGCVGVGVVFARLRLHPDDDVLRLGQQAGDAVEAVRVLASAQLLGVQHRVQRQHKAAVVVVQRHGQCFFCGDGIAALVITSDSHSHDAIVTDDAIGMIITVDCQLKQRLRVVGNFITAQQGAGGRIGYSRVNRVLSTQARVAAPAQGQRLGVCQAGVLNF